ncbi:MAG: TonB-dependent receptor [bacterium]
MRSWRLSVLIVLIVTSCVWAQALNPIRGFVVDAASEEPLPAANVVIEGAPLGAATNLDGYFVLSNLTPGTYTLTASYLGYHSTRMEVRVSEKLMEPIRIELIPAAVKLEEVVYTINGEEDELETRHSPKVSIIPLDAGTIRKLPSLAGEMDVMRSLQQLPGVKASSELNSALYVRGGSPDQTLIMMDHNVVYNPTHLFGLFSTFNADAVKRLELIKGGFPAEYGGRSGSVLEVITDEGNRVQSEGMLSIGAISARGALQGPLPRKRGSYAVSARRTYMEPIIEMLRKALDTDLPDYYFYDANGKINLDLSRKSTLTIAGYWGQDDMDLQTGPDDSPINFGLRWGNRTLSTRLRHVLSRDLFFSTGLSISRYRSTWKFVNDNVIIEEANDLLYDYALKMDLEYLGSQRHKLKTGFWVSYFDLLLAIGPQEKLYVDVHHITQNYSFYLQDRWRIHPLFEIQPGVRLYYHEAGNRFRWDPRLAMVYHYSPDLRFKLAGGRYTQWINLLSFGEGFSSFDIWVPLDETIEPSYSDQVVLGFEWEPKADLEFTSEAYYTDMNNVAIFNNLITDVSYDASKAFITGEGYAYGFEWMLRRKEGRLTGWIGYSLSWTKRRFPGTYENNGNWYYPKWDRRHDFVITALYELSPHWDVSSSWRFNTGQAFTQALGIATSRLAGVDPQYEPNDGRQIINGEKNNYRFPEDHRLDLTATWKHKLFKQDARLNISIYNLYSRRSYWTRYSETSENPVKIVDIKLLPILPMISYEVRF